MENGVVKKLTGGVEGLLKGNKVEIIRGEAYFVDANTLRVMTEDALKLIRLKCCSCNWFYTNRNSRIQIL